MRYYRFIFPIMTASLVMLGSFSTLFGVGRLTIVSETPTPISPALNSDIIPLLQELVADSDCELPCFLGMRPGETTGDEINQLITNVLELNAQAPVVRPSGAINYPLRLFFDSGALFLNLRGRNNQLSRMNVVLIKSEDWLENYNPFDLDVLLDAFGKPSNVYVAIQGANPLTFTFTLAYLDQGVMVQYMSDLAGVASSEPLPICPSLEGAVRVEAWLQSPNATRTVVGYLVPAPDAPDTFGSNWTLERMTGTDIDEFFELFTRDSTACLQAASTTDLYELGYRVSE